MINVLGAYLGEEEDLLGAGQDNPDGFWENTHILDIHERLLRWFDRFWHDTRPLPDGWWTEPGIARFRREIEDLVRKYVSEAALWAWKDPRTGILLPLWQAVLKDFGIPVGYVICVRNPIDVALSLERIHKFSLAKSTCLWQLYNLSALHWTSGRPRMVISYDQLLEDHETYLPDIIDQLRSRLAWPGKNDAGALAPVVKPGLRHNVHDKGDVFRNKDIPDPVKQLYSLLLRAGRDQNLASAQGFCRIIERLYADYCQYSSMFAPVSN